MPGQPITVDSEPRLREVYKLVCARGDVLAAFDMAEYAAREVNDMRHPLWLPLLDAVTITYARPFTNNKPFGPLPEGWARFKGAASQELHDRMIGIRHKLVAHSDADRRRVIIIPPGVEAMGRITDEPAVIIDSERMPPARFPEIRDHCRELVIRLHEATQTLLEKILREHDPPDYAFDLRTGQRLELPDDFRTLKANLHPLLASKPGLSSQ